MKSLAPALSVKLKQLPAQVLPVVAVQAVAAARDAAVRARIDAEALDGVADMLVKLYRCFTEGDCDLAEINPLILRPDGGVHALDAKVSLDNNAAFRHPEWDEFRATEELDDREQVGEFFKRFLGATRFGANHAEYCIQRVEQKMWADPRCQRH